MKDPLNKDEFADEPLELLRDQVKREKHEPTELQTPIPVWLLFLFFALFFWAGAYFIKFSGNMDAYVYDETASAVLVVEAAATDESAEEPAEVSLFEMGKQLYSQNCVACHQADGNGLAGVFPPLAGSEWVINDEQLPIAVLLNGLIGEIEVKGVKYNGAMPAFGHLSDDQIAAIVTYLRSNNDWGNNAGEVAVESVTKLREQFTDRSAPWSAADLAKAQLR